MPYKDQLSELGPYGQSNGIEQTKLLRSTKRQTPDEGFNCNFLVTLADNQITGV